MAWSCMACWACACLHWLEPPTLKTTLLAHPRSSGLCGTVVLSVDRLFLMTCNQSALYLIEKSDHSIQTSKQISEILSKLNMNLHKYNTAFTSGVPLLFYWYADSQWYVTLTSWWLLFVTPLPLQYSGRWSCLDNSKGNCEVRWLTFPVWMGRINLILYLTGHVTL